MKFSLREGAIGLVLFMVFILMVVIHRGGVEETAQREEALQDLKGEVRQQRKVIFALDQRVGESLGELHQQRKDAKKLQEDLENLIVSSNLRHKDVMHELKSLGGKISEIQEKQQVIAQSNSKRDLSPAPPPLPPQQTIASGQGGQDPDDIATRPPAEGGKGEPAKLFDCFLFNSELDWLEIHVNELIDVVDVFVLVEASRTFTNKPRVPLYQKYKEKLFPDQKVRDKIKHVLIEDFEPLIAPMNESIYKVYGDSWKRERAQRESMWQALLEAGMQPGDLVNLGDVDEIPRAQNLVDRKKGCMRFEGAPSLLRSHERRAQSNACKKFPVGLSLNNYMYNYWWGNNNSYFETQVFRYDGTNIKQISRSSIGVERVMNPRAVWYPENERGWHCSWCFSSLEEINRKFNSFSHQELNIPENNNPANIKWSICNGKSMFRKNFPDWTFQPVAPQHLHAPSYLKKMMGLPGVDKVGILNKKQLKVLEENEEAHHRFSYLIPSGTIDKEVTGPGSSVVKWSPSCDLPLKMREKFPSV